MRHLASAISVSLLLCICAVSAQADMLLYADFETDTGGFISADPTGELSVTHDPHLVFEGEGSLEFRYTQMPFQSDVPEWGLPGVLIIPVAGGAPDLSTISFALRSRLSTPVVITLGLGDEGPRYNRFIWSTAESWSQFELSLDEFIFDRDGPGDPEAPLEPGQITSIAVIDAHGFVRMIAEEEPLVHVDPPVQQTLWLDSFALSTRASAPVPELQQAHLLADYASPMRGFLPVGGTDLHIESERRPDGEYGLRVDYTTPARTLFGVLHHVPHGALADATSLRFNARTNRPLTLVVFLEEKRGPGELDKSRYESVVRLEPGEDLREITLPLALFELGEDQTDPDGALNLRLVEMLSIVDVTAAFEDTEVINTLHLSPPEVIR